MNTMTRADVMKLLTENRVRVAEKTAEINQAITSLGTLTDMATVTHVITMKMVLLQEELVVEALDNLLRLTDWNTIRPEDLRFEVFHPASVASLVTESDGTLTINQYMSVTYEPTQEVLSRRKFEQRIKTSGSMEA